MSAEQVMWVRRALHQTDWQFLFDKGILCKEVLEQRTR